MSETTDKSKHAEKRQFNRITFTSAAQLRQAQASWQTDIFDLSLQGALVAYPDEFNGDIEQQFTLDIPITDAQTPISMAGEIVHNANHCLGFKVSSIDIDSMTELRRVIELNLGDETLLMRDIKALSSD